MDYEDNVLCEKIIDDIHTIFQKDPNLSGFEIIPVPSNQNKSPVLHAEHNIGLESWCTKFIYKYAHETLMRNRLKSPLRCYQNTYLLKYMDVAILLNPDVATFWNMRKQLVQKLHLNIGQEFKFTGIVLGRKPKASEAYLYRRWLFGFQSEESIDWMSEIRLCEKLADKCANNYHAWCHRKWVLQKSPDLMQFEFNYTEKFIRRHISDYSCYFHRQYALRNLYQAGYSDPDEKMFKYIIDLASELTGNDQLNVDNLLSILLPRNALLQRSSRSLKSLTYCLNLAAYDIKMSAELIEMYGKREAFCCHRRAMIQFIYESCSLTQNESDSTGSNENKINENKDFLDVIYAMEDHQSVDSKRWCDVFLK